MQIRAAFANTARCSPRQIPAAIKAIASPKNHRRKTSPPFVFSIVAKSNRRVQLKGKKKRR